MTSRFPRTTEEFAAYGRTIALRCACGLTTWIRPENLVQRFGPDFDLFDGFMELEDTFPCEVCGAPRQEISFGNPRQQFYVRVSFEEATTLALERRAFARARDRSARLRNGEAPDPAPSIGRYRKFGPWRR
jgi:hypothetical protein